MKMTTLLTLCLFPSLLSAGTLSLKDARQLIKDSKPLSENDLKLGQTWECRAIGYDEKKKDFIPDDDGPYFQVFEKVPNSEDLYREKGPRSHPYKLTNFGLIQEVPTLLVGVDRLAKDGFRISETIMSAESAKSAGYTYTKLPSSVLSPKLLAAGYSVCRIKPQASGKR